MTSQTTEQHDPQLVSPPLYPHDPSHPPPGHAKARRNLVQEDAVLLVLMKVRRLCDEIGDLHKDIPVLNAALTMFYEELQRELVDRDNDDSSYRPSILLLVERCRGLGDHLLQVHQGRQAEPCPCVVCTICLKHREAIEPILDRLEKFARQATRHSPDFHSVMWFGRKYSFDASQALVIRELWAAWKRGKPEVKTTALMKKAKIGGRLNELFRGHPAWRDMIRTDGGTRKLIE